MAPSQLASISVATRTPPPAADQEQTNAVTPPIRDTQPSTVPSTGPSTTSSTSSLIFGSAPPKSDAIVEANRLQAERRAHNKQFGNQ
ncbi:MAG: hypothetical protein CMB79_21425 [Filomicrobium sp.]|nr:hypothetical protein [Filomicrobium sp.]